MALRATESRQEALPPELAHISNAIEASRFILDLTAGWDGEDGAPYSRAVWEKATRFLSLHARWLWETYSVRIDAPQIGPAPDGSIDLHWKGDPYELLVNIPANPAEPASFYGDDYGKHFIKGTIDSATFNRGLAVWLIDHK